jgi:hypothetical protein
VAGEAGQSEPQNVESRVWRPSLARRSSGGRRLDHRFLPCSRWWNDYYGDHGFRTLTPLILVRIQVPQPGILLKSLRICSFLGRRNSLETSARWLPGERISANRRRQENSADLMASKTAFPHVASGHLGGFVQREAFTRPLTTLCWCAVASSTKAAT